LYDLKKKKKKKEKENKKAKTYMGAKRCLSPVVLNKKIE